MSIRPRANASGPEVNVNERRRGKTSAADEQ
jgi:hypothetical protein